MTSSCACPSARERDNRAVLLKKHGGEPVPPIWIGVPEAEALVYQRSAYTSSRQSASI